MSAQTGTPSFIPSVPSARMSERVKNRWRMFITTPNPVLIRELRQSARLTRTPFILMTLTVMVALIQCTIGGIVGATSSSATTGMSLYHTFFSLAFFVVTIVGPALAANGVASEREGRTWEAVILTGLSPKTIALGKFMAAFTSIATYIVMLAPVGALPFLFGGVTTLDIVMGFVYLLAFSVLSVALGLAISSALSSGRVAIVLTLLLAFGISIVSYVICGPLMSIAVSELWSAIVAGPPIWLPMAYTRAPFSVEYIAFLVFIPVIFTVVPAWFLFEITVANIQGITDDRASGLKRWLMVVGPLVTIGLCVGLLATGRSLTFVAISIVMTSMWMFWVFVVFVFQAEAIGPSRRVLTHWDRIQAGFLRRFLGPGMWRTMVTIMVMGTVALAALGAIAFVWLMLDKTIIALDRTTLAAGIIALSLYLTTYLWFVCGLAAWLRSFDRTVTVARVMLFASMFLTIVGPWIVVSMAGALMTGDLDSLLLGASSPVFAYLIPHVFDDLDQQVLLIFVVGFCAVYGGAGLLLLRMSRTRCKRMMQQQKEYWLTVHARLQQEDAAQQQASEPTDNAAIP